MSGLRSLVVPAQRSNTSRTPPRQKCVFVVDNNKRGALHSTCCCKIPCSQEWDILLEEVVFAILISHCLKGGNHFRNFARLWVRKTTCRLILNIINKCSDSSKGVSLGAPLTYGTLFSRKIWNPLTFRFYWVLFWHEAVLHFRTFIIGILSGPSNKVIGSADAAVLHLSSCSISCWIIHSTRVRYGEA